jgi:hypothetical protein
LEDFLADRAAPEFQPLLHELILIDAEYRLQAGESPRAADYAERLQGLDPGWLAANLTEQTETRSEKTLAHTMPSDFSWRGMHPPHSNFANCTPTSEQDESDANPGSKVRCPHCHNPIQLNDKLSDDVLCPGCGSSFRLRDAKYTDTASGMKSLGKFQLLERLGLGGFGAVWKARDTELDRIVALKIPHTGLLTNAEELERFQREARAAAQLRHPNIVTVHEVATLNGLPVIVAEFVPGVPLKDLLEMRRLTFRGGALAAVSACSKLTRFHLPPCLSACFWRARSMRMRRMVSAAAAKKRRRLRQRWGSSASTRRK